MKERIKHFILLIILIAIDQGSKYWVRTVLINKEKIDIIPDVLNLQYSVNTGAVWGIFSGKVDFLKILTLIMLAALLFLYFKIPEGKKYKVLKLLAVFIIAGAIGNLIDRFYLGHVVDFIYFEIINFPLFNFADCCLTVSSILLFILALFYYKEEDFVFLNNLFRGKKTLGAAGSVKDSYDQKPLEDSVEGTKEDIQRDSTEDK
jgi:signal peptidase II